VTFSIDFIYYLIHYALNSAQCRTTYTTQSRETVYAQIYTNILRNIHCESYKLHLSSFYKSFAKLCSTLIIFGYEDTQMNFFVICIFDILLIIIKLGQASITASLIR